MECLYILWNYLINKGRNAEKFAEMEKALTTIISDSKEHDKILTIVVEELKAQRKDSNEKFATIDKTLTVIVEELKERSLNFSMTTIGLMQMFLHKPHSFNNYILNC